MKRVLFILCFVVLAWIPATASAATVAPALIEITTKRGERVEQFIQVINTGTTEQTYYLGVMKFEPTEGTGTPSFIPYEEDRSGLPEWISFKASEFAVPANSKVDAPFFITIPDDIHSGGHYAAITVATTPFDVVASNGAIVDAKTAVLLLLTVEGETNESAALLDFTSEMNGKTVSSVTGSFLYRIQNQGNVHVKPEGTLRLVDVFGREVYTQSINEAQGRVLPSSTRTYKEVIDLGGASFFETLSFQMRTLLIGPVRAELDVYYGYVGPLSAYVSFWFLPWQLIVTVLVLILVLVKLFKRRRTR